MTPLPWIRKILFWLSAVLGGVVMGGGWLYSTMTLEKANSQVTNGPWFTSELYGAETADPFTRTTVALSGLFALSKKETVYYTSISDDAGDLLDAGCNYQVTGMPLPSRWWSITLYDAEHFLVENTANRYAFNMKNLEMNKDGSFTINISRKPKDKNWLPAPKTGQGPEIFSLTLRLYNPANTIYSHLKDTPLPQITKGDCV